MKTKTMTKDKDLLPVTARGEATRRKILDAAEIEFGEKGFHSASVSSITQRADVGQGTFYLYFHAKEEIFSTLVKEIGRSLRRAMAVSVATGKGRLDAERKGFEAFFEFARNHPGLYRIVQEAQFVDEPIFRAYYQTLADGYAMGLEAAAKSGELAPGDAAMRAWALMGIGHMVGMRHCLWAGEAPSKEQIDELMQLVSHGMAPGSKR